MRKTRPGVLTQGNAWGVSHDSSSSVDRASRRSSSSDSSKKKSTNDGRGEGPKVQQPEDASRRFEEACAIMKQNAQKFMGDIMECESSASEDELDDLSIIKKTLQEYNGNGATDLMKTQEVLLDSLTSGALVCLICIESIKRNAEIWSCLYCHCMLHLGCIQKWAKDSLFHLSSSTDDENKNVVLKWCCPKCRYEYKPSEKPTKYYCFCGKVEDPQFDPWNVPHSCGQSCEKFLKPECGHTCSLLCHPGSCPPCPQTVQISCYCSKSKPTVRRCSTKEWSCGKPCAKLLSCNRHNCKEPCHEGDCPSCLKQSQQNCECGHEKKMRPCNDPVWQCEKVCMKPLECGNHWCAVKCHSGGCPPCPKSGARPCPCTKKIAWLPCTEDVVPCGDTCDKPLECGVHNCAQRCHFGPCDICLQMRVKKCRCMHKAKSVPCSKEYLCENKCRRRKDCGRHNCNRKCCIGNCLPCDAPCGRTLNCRSHKCDSRCHPGPCYPCKETFDITCNCGKTKINVPCGRRKSSVPPRCIENCKVRSKCHHKDRHKHNCHFGNCPPCPLVCEKKLECGHLCPSKCHSAVLTKVETNKKNESWNTANAFKMTHVNKPCPPCQAPMPVICPGGHETINLPCSEVKSTSCGRACGRLLLCGNHTCQLECHDVKGATDLVKHTPSCQTCEEPCTKQRKKDCKHLCKRQCHSDECKPCHEKSKQLCHCKLLTLYISCNEWSEADTEKRNKLLTCPSRCNKEMSCGHSCVFNCHKDKCSNRDQCKKKITIRCPCKRLKKEVQCRLLTENNLSCDDDCLRLLEEAKALQQAEEERERIEEEKKQQLLVNEFLRKSEGKRKRRRKVGEIQEVDSWLRKHVLFITACLVVILGFLIFGYLKLFR